MNETGDKIFMKKNLRIWSAVTAGMVAASVLAGCGSNDSSALNTVSVPEESIPTSTASAPAEASTEASTEQTSAEIPDGDYLSELTGTPISEDIKDQRPIAAMVDNEKTALPHYGTADADIVYELMNRTENDRVTRLMCVVKDWGAIKQLGSIRSTRPTNILLMGEYNAVLCHDGGPFYIDEYLKNAWADHLSGVFSRVKNGKDWEFTEYICTGDLDSNLDSAGISKTYNQYAVDSAKTSHFQFAQWGTEFDLADKYSDASAATDVDLSAAFKHNKSALKYHDSTGTYDYYEYGSRHEDADSGDPLTFKNVILENCTFSQLDKNGYLIYNCIASNQKGYYLTNGKMIPIFWTKTDATQPTQFFDADGNELVLNTGKTYISLVPSDYWDSITIQ